MKGISSIFAYVKRHKGKALLNVGSNFLSTVFDKLSILIFIPFLQLIFGESQPLTQAPEFEWSKQFFEDWYHYKMGSLAQGEPTNALFYVCLSLGILFLLKNIFRFFGMYYRDSLKVIVGSEIRQDLFAKVLALPLGQFSEKRKGDVITRFSADVEEIQNNIVASMELLVREPINLILTLTIMLIISPQLTLFALVLLPISGLIIGKLGKSLRRSSRKGQSKLGEILSRLDETLNGLRIIKAFTGEERSQKKFDQESDQYVRVMSRLFMKRDLASPLSEFLGVLVMLSLVYYGGNLILNPKVENPLSPTEFMGYILFFFSLLKPAQSLTGAFAGIQKGMASVERIEELLNTENDIREKESPLPLISFEKEIRFEKVHFKYANNWVLKNINLSIPKGKTIALVGESGGGKSTLSDLIPRFYDCQEGGIYIDGNDLKDLKIKDLRHLIGMVSQESILFNDSVYNNISFGVDRASEQEVMAAAKIANAHEFIENLEEGYQSNIGEGGSKLSGGQRQRLSIARAVLKNPPIMILDEATSALDTESEKLVQDALNNLMKNRTSVVIAHRLSTIQHADEIVVMQKGEIAERGKHEELMALGGVYKRLCDLQSFQ